MPKASKRKFYRGVIEIEVLSEEPIPDPYELETLVYDITEGHCSGRARTVVRKKVDGPQMARLLEEQGSDPGFFNLTPEGADADEEE